MNITVNNQTPDKYQKKVLKNNSQSLLVIAGAGSGKTFTIIAKVKKIIKDGINPEDILCISFTRESAKDLDKKLKKENINIKVKTFHSLGYELINNYKRVQLSDSKLLNKIVEKEIQNNNNLNKILNLKFKRIGKPDKAFNKMENNIILNTKNKEKLKIILINFVNLFKSNNYKIKDFNNFQKLNKSNNLYDKRIRHKLFLKLAKNIIQKYQKELKKRKIIDYHDMINLATYIVKNNKIYPYKYIIIDEYQDTSSNKNELIREIQKQTKCKLMTVGDDWQSIYGFSGSNLESFTNFKQMFPNSKVIKLKNTYRNSKELLYISRKFICKNKLQLKKRLKSAKRLKYPIYICYYKKNIKEILKKIKLNNDTLVLGRNNKDINMVPKELKFKTIHKSKGLECFDTVILNLEDKYNSFPSKIKESEYLKYVKPKIDSYPYAEERRLFYVAITRCKNRNYLFVNKDNPSMFVKEIIKDYKKYIKIKDFSNNS